MHDAVHAPTRTPGGLTALVRGSDLLASGAKQATNRPIDLSWISRLRPARSQNDRMPPPSRTETLRSAAEALKALARSASDPNEITLALLSDHPEAIATDDAIFVAVVLELQVDRPVRVLCDALSPGADRLAEHIRRLGRPISVEITTGSLWYSAAAADAAIYTPRTRPAHAEDLLATAYLCGHAGIPLVCWRDDITAGAREALSESSTRFPDPPQLAACVEQLLSDQERSRRACEAQRSLIDSGVLS